jgi:hypothetical protein
VVVDRLDALPFLLARDARDARANHVLLLLRRRLAQNGRGLCLSLLESGGRLPQLLLGLL